MYNKKTGKSMNLVSEKPGTTIICRISTALKQEIQAAAHKENLTPSAFMRIALFEKINSSKEK